MSRDTKKGYTIGLFGLLGAFLVFWGIQTENCTSRIATLTKRITSLERTQQKLNDENFKNKVHIVELTFELSRKESLLHTIESYLDKFPFPAWIKVQDPHTGKITMATINEEYEQKYNISKEKYAGLSDSEVWPEDLADKFKEADLEVLRTKSSIETQEEVIEGGMRKVARVIKFYYKIGNRDAIGGVIVD